MFFPLTLHLLLQSLIEVGFPCLILQRVFILLVQSFEDGIPAEYVFVDEQGRALVLGVHSSLWNKITIKIQLRGMSLRRDQKRRMQPIINVITDCLRQNGREVAAQLHVNEGIVEELLQTDLLSRLQSLPALKLILYELILLLSQQYAKDKGEQSIIPSPRISDLLFTIRDVLKDFATENEETPLRAIEKRNNKEININDRTQRNRHRILSSYYSQYCSLLEQIEKQGTGKDESSMLGERNGAEEALIDQLESLVFKKQSIIENLERQLQEQRSINLDLDSRLSLLKYQHQALFQQKLLIEQQRESLREELQTLRQQIDSDPPSSFIEAGRCFWSDSEQPTPIPQKTELPQSDLLKCLLSQALTIQAFLE